MKYLVLLALTVGLVGCETTGNKRQNGTNTEHVNAKLKNITVHGALTIGGGKQDTRGASQEGLGRALNGQEDALKALVVPTLPPAPEGLEDPLPAE